jgi:hypothetical protein
MIRVLGSSKRLCDGMTRRDLLQAGGIALLSLGFRDLVEASSVRSQTWGRTFLFALRVPCFRGAGETTGNPTPHRESMRSLKHSACFRGSLTSILHLHTIRESMAPEPDHYW